MEYICTNDENASEAVSRNSTNCLYNKHDDERWVWGLDADVVTTQ